MVDRLNISGADSDEKIPDKNSQTTEKIRVLLVDDEPDITTTIKSGLETYGYEVDAFNDPEKVLSDYKPNYYDALLIDIKMPRLDGFQLCREIKKKDPTARVAFITAFEVYHEEFKKMFPDIEVRYFIRKPISIGQLVKQLNSGLLGNGIRS